MGNQISPEKLHKIVMFIMWLLIIAEIIFFVIYDYQKFIHYRINKDAIWALESLVRYA